MQFQNACNFKTLSFIKKMLKKKECRTNGALFTPEPRSGKDSVGHPDSERHRIYKPRTLHTGSYFMKIQSIEAMSIESIEAMLLSEL